MAEKKTRPPAKTPQAREDQMIALAIETAEKQMREGSASSQIISHYLKLASSRERLEQEKLAKENELLRAKTEAIESAKRVEELVEIVEQKLRLYSGNADMEEYESYHD